MHFCVCLPEKQQITLKISKMEISATYTHETNFIKAGPPFDYQQCAHTV